MAFGAKRVEEMQHLRSGIETPLDESSAEADSQNGMSGGPVATELGAATLSMFQQGSRVSVRLGSATNSSELYEGTFEDAAEANAAMLEVGILRPEQVIDSGLLAGTGIKVEGLTAQQLDAANLKRRVNATI